MLRTKLTACLLGLAMATPAAAQVTDVMKWARDLGIAVGEAYTCVEGQEKIEARTLSEVIYDTITFEMNHEIAYLYAVGVGYGAALERNDKDCDALKAHLEQLKGWSGSGGAQ